MTVIYKAKDGHFSEHPDELRLAEKLDEAFDITFASKRGEYSFWLAKPQQITKERFGLDQEVLVIYSRHHQTDARFINTIENISRNPDFRHRLDKILVLLIHNGNPEETNALIRKTNDWIIVPFHAEELRSNKDNPILIRRRIAEFFGAIDLYGMSAPIDTDKYFYGRDELVTELIQRATQHKQNSGLFGLRKTGKTSFLYAIQRRASIKGVIAEYIDCQNTSIYSNRWWTALQSISEKLFISLSSTLGHSLTIDKQYEQHNAGSLFVRDIKLLIEKTEANSILLLLDEIEWITPKITGFGGQHWDADFVPFWQTLRSAFQETHCKLTFIVAGVNPVLLESPHFEKTVNPIFQIAKPFFLEPLTKDQVRNMVRTIGKYAGLKYEENAYAHLCTFYGGHPYLIRLACSTIWEKTKNINEMYSRTVAAADFNKIHPDITAKLSSPIKDILLSLVWWYPELYDILRVLASGDVEFVTDYLKGLPETAQKLYNWGLLKKDTSTFAIYDLQHFIVNHGDEYKNEISPFTRHNDINPNMLPEIPNKELLTKLFELKLETESKLRKLIFFTIGVSCGFDQSKISKIIIEALTANGKKNASDMFVGREPKDTINEFYTLDLKYIISHHWDKFSSFFGSNKDFFECNMETINVGRRFDSHSKPISEDEYATFESAFRWILSKLNKLPS